MDELLILKLQPPEDRAAPELEYLLGFVMAEARAVFAGVRLLTLPAGSDRGAPEGDEPFVLLLGTASVLLGRGSLAALRRQLADGAPWAAPLQLAATDLPRRHDLFTLRDFETAEAEVLAGPVADDDAAAVLPASLWRRESWHRLLAGRAPAEVLSGTAPELPPELARGAVAGLCHSFIDYYGEVRADVLPLIPPGTRKVLEVGCARGATGRLLQERLGCEVWGVELNPEIARQAAGHLTRVLQGDVQTLEPAARDFDLVLALELFEHLTDNERFLRRAAGWLRPGGQILLSVPNVGHYSVVEDLVAGRWDYLPIGLLCYTHYRFFTRATLESWLARCGFEHCEILPQKTPLPDRLRQLPASFQPDFESLATSGFYVRILP